MPGVRVELLDGECHPDAAGDLFIADSYNDVVREVIPLVRVALLQQVRTGRES